MCQCPAGFTGVHCETGRGYAWVGRVPCVPGPSPTLVMPQTPRQNCLLKAQTLGLSESRREGAATLALLDRVPGRQDSRGEGRAGHPPRMREIPTPSSSTPPFPFFPLSSPPSPRHPFAARAHSLGVLQRWMPATPAPASMEASARTVAGPTCVSAQRVSSATTVRQVGHGQHAPPLAPSKLPHLPCIPFQPGVWAPPIPTPGIVSLWDMSLPDQAFPDF